jgi:Tfp pilus assembly protein PilV
MSIFNFTNHKVACQKGFLLLEAMVTLCALSILMMGIASSYIHSLLAHAATQERLQAVLIASSFMGKLQIARKIPQAGSHKQEGYSLDVVAVQDQTNQRFYWVEVTVKKDAPDSGDKKVSAVTLICGVGT